MQPLRLDEMPHFCFAHKLLELFGIIKFVVRCLLVYFVLRLNLFHFRQVGTIERKFAPFVQRIYVLILDPVVVLWELLDGDSFYVPVESAVLKVNLLFQSQAFE